MKPLLICCKSFSFWLEIFKYFLLACYLHNLQGIYCLVGQLVSQLIGIPNTFALKTFLCSQGFAIKLQYCRRLARSKEEGRGGMTSWQLLLGQSRLSTILTMMMMMVSGHDLCLQRSIISTSLFIHFIRPSTGGTISI